jgi:hypothetical protein
MTQFVVNLHRFDPCNVLLDLFNEAGQLVLRSETGLSGHDLAARGLGAGHVGHRTRRTAGGKS